MSRLRLVGAAALLVSAVGVLVAAPAEAHGTYWTHLTCTSPGAVTASMDVSNSFGDSAGNVTITRVDYNTDPRPYAMNEVRLMLSRGYGAFSTIAIWTGPTPGSVQTSFGSHQADGIKVSAVGLPNDRFKLKVTGASTYSSCASDPANVGAH